MQDSTGARLDLEAMRGRVGAVRVEVSELGSALEPQRAGHLTMLTRQLDEMDQALVSQLGRLEVMPLRVACPFCGNMIMPNATLCGFCWRAQTPKTAAHP